jgi:hypothetical protein
MQAAHQRRTTPDNSRGMSRPSAAINVPDGLRAGLWLPAPAGVGALVAATLQTVIEITVGTTTRLAASNPSPAAGAATA